MGKRNLAVAVIRGAREYSIGTSGEPRCRLRDGAHSQLFAFLLPEDPDLGEEIREHRELLFRVGQDQPFHGTGQRLEHRRQLPHRRLGRNDDRAATVARMRTTLDKRGFFQSVDHRRGGRGAEAGVVRELGRAGGAPERQNVETFHVRDVDAQKLTDRLMKEHANYQGAAYGWQRFLGGLERVIAGRDG